MLRFARVAAAALVGLSLAAPAGAEDTILSLDMLKAGFCTIQFNAFLQYKEGTQKYRGGNTDEFYLAEGKKQKGAKYADTGTVAKSEMLAKVHPDVARVAWRFGRWHHVVDYSPFKWMELKRRDDAPVASGVNNYGMELQIVGGAE